MVWTAANGVRQTTKLSTRTSAFLAAFLLAISSLATTVSPFVEQAFAETSAVRKLAVTTSAQTIKVNQASSPINVQTQNGGDQEETLDGGTGNGATLTLATSSSTGEFSDASLSGGTCSNWGTNSLTLSAGSANKAFCYRDSTPGTYTLTITSDIQPNKSQTVSPATQQILVKDDTLVSTPVPAARITAGGTQVPKADWQAPADGQATYELNYSLDKDGNITNTDSLAKLNGQHGPSGTSNYNGLHGYSGINVTAPTGATNFYVDQYYNYQSGYASDHSDVDHQRRDPDSGSYPVQNGIADLYTNVAERDSTTSTAWQPMGNHTDYTTIYWQDQSGNTIKVETLDITVNDNSVSPQAPATPANPRLTQSGAALKNNATNHTGSNLWFQWDSVDGAKDYVVVWTAPDGQTRQAYPVTDPHHDLTGWVDQHGQGVYELQVYAENSVGQSALTDIVDFIYDHGSPSAGFTQETPQFANGNFKVYGEAHDNVKLKSVGFDVRLPNDPDGNDWEAGCVSGTLDAKYTNGGKDATFNCEINASSSALQDDTTYKLRVSASDYANYGGSESHDLTIDRTSPVIKINGNDVTGNPYFKLGQPINVHVLDRNLSETDVSATSRNKDNLWNYHAGQYFGLQWLRDGDYSMTSADKAGNQTLVTFRVDHTRPVVSGEPTGATVNGDTYNPESFAITANDDASNNPRADKQSGLAKVAGNVYKYDPANPNARSDGYYLLDSNSTTEDTLAVNLSSLSDGKYYVRYNSQDVAGNVSQTKTFFFVVDRTAPTGWFTYSNDNGNELTNGDVTVTLTTTEAVQAVSDGWVSVAGTDNEFTKVFTDNGVINAVITDLAGNSSMVTGDVKRIDRAKPTFLNVSDGDVLSGNPFVIQVRDPQLTGKSYFGLVSKLDVNGSPVVLTEGAGHIFTASLTGDGAYEVTATDKAGNEVTVRFTIDSNAPNFSVVYPTNNVLDGATLVFSGTAHDEGVGISEVNGQEATYATVYDRTDSNNVVSRTYRPVVDPATHQWVLDTSSVDVNKGSGESLANFLANGHVYQATFKAIDKIGNQATGNSFSFTYNNTVPTVTTGDFATWNNLVGGGFNAVNVGFGAKDFKDISGITVELLDKDGNVITRNTANQSFIDMINANPDMASSLSSPFVVDGTLNDTYCDNGPCWSGDNYTWTANSEAPVSALVTITGTDARGDNASAQQTSSPLNESMATFASLRPQPAVLQGPQPQQDPSSPSDPNDDLSKDKPAGNNTTPGGNSYTPLFAAASAAPAGAVLGDSTTTSNDPANTDDQGQVKADETTNADPAVNTGDPLNQCTKFFGLCWYWYIPIVIVVIAILYWLFKPRHDNKPA